MISRRVGGFVFVASFVAAALVGSAAHAATKVSCVGENTTCTGHYAANLQWPDVLGQMLGAGYTVDNDGDNTHATVLMKDSGATPPVPYAGSYANPANAAAPCGGGYPRSLMSPDIVVIGPWGMHDYTTAATNALTTDQARFQKDYEFLVSQYLKLANKPKVFLATPILLSVVGGNVKAETATYITNIILPSVKAVAAAHNLPIIDLYTQFPASLLDPGGDGGITHPAGQTKIAQLVMAAIGASSTTGGGGSGGGAGGAAGATAGTGGGAAGTTGAAGATGVAGNAGGAGTSGAAGSTTGAAGSTTGAAGSTSATGAAGDTSTTGAAGSTSVTGAAGSTSTTGAAGATGAAGSGAAQHHASGGCSVADRAEAGALGSLLLAMALAIPSLRRRRR